MMYQVEQWLLSYNLSTSEIYNSGWLEVWMFSIEKRWNWICFTLLPSTYGHIWKPDLLHLYVGWAKQIEVSAWIHYLQVQCIVIPLFSKSEGAIIHRNTFII